MTQSATLLRQALIDNAELTQMFSLQRRARVRKANPKAAQGYEDVFVLVAPHVQNITNVIDGMLVSPDDGDVHLALDALAACLRRNPSDISRIRDIVVGKLGYYSTEIEPHLIQVLLEDPSYFDLQKLIEAKWDSFNTPQQIAAIVLMGQMQYKPSTEYLTELSQKGSRQIRAFASEQLARKAGVDSKRTPLQTLQTMLMSPDEFGRVVDNVRRLWDDSAVMVERELRGSGALPSRPAEPTPPPTREEIERVLRPVPSPVTHPEKPVLEIPSTETPKTSLGEGIIASTKTAFQEYAEEERRTGVGAVPDSDDGEGIRMSLLDHLDELRLRFLRIALFSVFNVFLLVSVVYFGDLDRALFGIVPSADLAPRSILNLSVLTLGLTLSLPGALLMIFYQFSMFILPGLTRREKRWYILIVPLVLTGITLLFALTFGGAVLLTRDLAMGLDTKYYLVEKLTFGVLPSILFIVSFIAAIRYLINNAAQSELYGVIVSFLVMTTGKWSGIFVGQRDAEAMKRRIETGFGVYVRYQRQLSLKRNAQSAADLMAAVPRYLRNRLIALSLILLLPFPYAAFPILVLFLVFIFYGTPRGIIQWSLSIGKFIAQMRAAVAEVIEASAAKAS